jgi:DNA-binding LacI/PurR family transcriptional regulator
VSRPTMRPTMEDVAREAGVSRALVSLVFRDMPQVSEQRRAAVMDAASRLGYRRDAVARRLASKHSHVIGVVWNDVGNPVFAETTDQLQDRADARGYQLIFGAANRQTARERAAIDTLLEHRPDGLILLGCQQPADVLADVASQVPLALVSRIVRQPTVDCFAVDEARGAALAVRHLVALGHERIAHVDGGRGAGASGRRSGYRRAMAECGLKSRIHVVPGTYTEASGVSAAEELLAGGELPTAVFAANDLIALGLITAFRDAGVAVPTDVSVVGFDDSVLARLMSVSLTTVAQTMADLGARAFDAVLERIADPRREAVVDVVEPHLVVRSSTAAPRV